MAEVLIEQNVAAAAKGRYGKPIGIKHEVGG
jgi:hypothetical protein